MRWNKTPYRFGILLSAFIACVVGCGEAETNRVAVSGRVTLDGEPLATGAVTFLPSADGFSAGATLADGKFSIDKKGGPSPGRYRVEIVSYEPTGETIPDPDLPNHTTELTRQIVPARYNRSTELTVEVKPDGKNQFEFALKSQ